MKPFKYRCLCQKNNIGKKKKKKKVCETPCSTLPPKILFLRKVIGENILKKCVEIFINLLKIDYVVHWYLCSKKGKEKLIKTKSAAKFLQIMRRKDEFGFSSAELRFFRYLFTIKCPIPEMHEKNFLFLSWYFTRNKKISS